MVSYALAASSSGKRCVISGSICMRPWATRRKTLPCCGFRSSVHRAAGSPGPALHRRIVASRSIGARHQHLNFFQVSFIPGEIQFHRADIHDAAAIAANVHGNPAGSVRLSGGSNDYAIHALPVGESACCSRILNFPPAPRRSQAYAPVRHDQAGDRWR